MPSIGPMELVVVLVLALVVLGPKRLPDAGRSIGKGMREFKSAISGDDKHELDTSHFEASSKASAPQPVAERPAA